MTRFMTRLVLCSALLPTGALLAEGLLIEGTLVGEYAPNLPSTETAESTQWGPKVTRLLMEEYSGFLQFGRIECQIEIDQTQPRGKDIRLLTNTLGIHADNNESFYPPVKNMVVMSATGRLDVDSEFTMKLGGRIASETTPQMTGSISVFIERPDGSIVESLDWQLPENETFATPYEVFTGSLPAGDYRLHLVMEAEAFEPDVGVDLYADASARFTFVEGLFGEALCRADLDGDGTVGGSDLTRLLSAWNTDRFDADLDNSGFVDGADLAEFLARWGVCSP